MAKNKFRAYDFFGSLVVVNFPRGYTTKQKQKFAIDLMKKQKAIKTVLEKVGKVHGRLRKIITKHIAGERTKEVLYRENNCTFRFNIDKTYFSPRLSNERKEIASKIKKGDKVLVMFAGVAPYSIVIAKNSKAEVVYSVEINREAHKYARLNVELNKVKNKVEIIQGNVKKFANSKSPTKRPRPPTPKFDVIVMPRPQLKETFLKQAFALSKKGTRIFYYDFCKKEKNGINVVVNKVKSEAKKTRKKIKIVKKKVAGDISPSKIRVRIDLKITS